MIDTLRACLIGGLFFLTSCSYLAKKDAKVKQFYTPSSYELEARLSDCALPLGFKILVNQSDELQQIIQGITPLHVDELIEFYEHDMERLGWELRAVFTLEHTNLIFIKPHTAKTCLITLSRQSYKRGSTVEIFIKK